MGGAGPIVAAAMKTFLAKGGLLLIGATNTMMAQAGALQMDNFVKDATCFNVCGRDYESMDPESPLCHRGGPVLSYQWTEYACPEQMCGPARSTKVAVDVKTLQGQRVHRADTTTDDAGRFSYTFDAPSADGQYYAHVKVPR
jgi:hypothetical protein